MISLPILITKAVVCAGPYADGVSAIACPAGIIASTDIWRLNWRER
jgi:hypothetical protein